MNEAKEWKLKEGGNGGKKKWRKIVEKRRKESEMNEGRETKAGKRKEWRNEKTNKVKKKGNKCEVGKTKENRSQSVLKAIRMMFNTTDTHMIWTDEVTQTLGDSRIPVEKMLKFVSKRQVS